MHVNALLALGCYAAIARADVADNLEDASSSVGSAATEASSSAASVVESVTSSAIDRPTFTVGSLLSQLILKLTHHTAHHPQSSFPRAVHQRLGIEMASFPREEGEHRRRVAVRWHVERGGTHRPPRYLG